MIEILGTILTSVLGGGATGLLGMLVQRWFDHKRAVADLQMTRLQLDAARETRAMELAAQERMAANAEATKALQAQLEAQSREVEADERAYAASMQGDQARYVSPAAQERPGAIGAIVTLLMGLVDTVRGLMRPGITAYCMVMLTLVFIWVRELYGRAGVAMTPQQVHELAMQCVGTVFYLATATTVWWFGVRPGQPPRSKG